MVRQVPRRDWLPGRTDLLRLTLEPSSRDSKEIAEKGLPHSAIVSSRPGRYVACIVSFSGSQSSPFFHSRRVTETIFLASVTLASSSLTPRASEA